MKKTAKTSPKSSADLKLDPKILARFIEACESSGIEPAKALEAMMEHFSDQMN